MVMSISVALDINNQHSIPHASSKKGFFFFLLFLAGGHLMMAGHVE